MYRGFPHAFNSNDIIDVMMRIASTWPYKEVTRNFTEYLNVLMYLGQAMIDSRTRLDHVHDFQELHLLCESSHALRELLTKEKKEWKALEDYKKEYDPAMETLRQEKQHLHEDAGRYIVEKNNFMN